MIGRRPAAIITKTLDVSPRAAQLNIAKLIEAGIPVEATGKQRGLVYVAEEIINVIEAT